MLNELQVALKSEGVIYSWRLSVDRSLTVTSSPASDRASDRASDTASDTASACKQMFVSGLLFYKVNWIVIREAKGAGQGEFHHMIHHALPCYSFRPITPCQHVNKPRRCYRPIVSRTSHNNKRNRWLDLALVAVVTSQNADGMKMDNLRMIYHHFLFFVYLLLLLLLLSLIDWFVLFAVFTSWWSSLLLSVLLIWYYCHYRHYFSCCCCSAGYLFLKSCQEVKKRLGQELKVKIQFQKKEEKEWRGEENKKLLRELMSSLLIGADGPLSLLVCELGGWGWGERGFYGREWRARYRVIEMRPLVSLKPGGFDVGL